MCWDWSSFALPHQSHVHGHRSIVGLCSQQLVFSTLLLPQHTGAATGTHGHSMLDHSYCVWSLGKVFPASSKNLKLIIWLKTPSKNRSGIPCLFFYQTLLLLIAVMNVKFINQMGKILKFIYSFNRDCYLLVRRETLIQQVWVMCDMICVNDSKRCNLECFTFFNLYSRGFGLLPGSPYS